MSRFTTSAGAVLLILSLTTPLHAQRNLTDIPDPDPEIERQSFQVADGFEVNLFAADPILAKPIQMNFDSAGRLWLVSSEVYPQIKPGQVANDKVIVLEDRDGDGRAERTTVFVEGLLIPTGIEPGDGGAYVANSTELLHFRDTDGDGRADERRVMLSGFGTEDTHHILHTLRWGFDGLLYFNQSIYIHSHVETPHGVRRLGGGGIWQLRPETMQLEVFLRGLINPWGHHFDRWGQSFATDGAGGEGINYALPGGTYASIPNPPRYVQGLNPGSPKYCGLEVVSGRHLPDDWQGNLLTNDFRGNRVCRFIGSDDGAGFAAREQPELIKTKHVAFRPIDVKMGPDGAIYIADWYNPIIQHGEVDFRDPRRDHTRGRIWRVTAKGRPTLPRPKLVGASVQELLEALKAPEDWTRHHARRQLKERGANNVEPALAAWIERLDPAEPDVEHRRLEALWVYQALDVVQPGLLAATLESHDPRVRAAATRVVPHWQARLSDPRALLAARVVDEHPRVRLEAVRALAAIPGARSAEIALRALEQPSDRFLDYALWLTCRELAPDWLPAAKRGRFDDEGHPRRLVYALEAVGSPAAVGPLREALRTGKVPADQEERVLGLIAAMGEPRDLTLVLDLVIEGAAIPADRRARLLEALGRATRDRKKKPEGDLARLGRLLEDQNEGLQAAGAEAAGVWRVESVRPRLTDLARANDTTAKLRRAALEALASLGGPASRASLAEVAGPAFPPEVRQMAVEALTALDLPAAADLAAGVLEAPGHTQPAELFHRFLQRKGGSLALAKALKRRTLPADVAKLGVREARASGQPEPALVEAFTRAGKLSTGPATLSAQERSQLITDVTHLGDPARGEAVFRRADTGCLKCHAIAGAGGQVGPDLVSIGASAPVDYLLDSLLDPNKAIKENYHALTVATDDGRVLTGLKVRQTEAELVLRDADDREVAIPLSSVEEQKPAGSLMPAGLADTLTKSELVDLVRFLSELGKVGSRYSVGRARVVRRWQAAALATDARPDLRNAGLEVAVNGDSRLRWVPVYSQVSGALPLADVPSVQIGSSGAAVAFLRFQIEVSRAGPVLLKFSDSVALTAWLDGNRFPARKEVALDLSAGSHTITLAVDVSRQARGFRVEWDDVAGSPAQAQVIGGK